MIFDFTLDPIENVYPWGDPEDLKIHWFALTQGNYRLKVGNDYLLNYTNDFHEYLTEKHPQNTQPKNTCVDYYVVRLWEDILDILPDVLEPVPKELQHFLELGYENYKALNERALDWQEFEIKNGANKDRTWSILELATNWLNNCWLDSGYILYSPKIWIWSDENDVVINWDNSEIKIENIYVWTATKGNYRINKNDFINEVREFNKHLFDEMKERVETICQNWKNDEIKIDFEQLKSEQKNRGTWLESKLKNVRKTNWSEVISAINQISA